MKIHFIGIGGIGVSALARYYLKQGYEVSGSDLVSSEITDALKKLGAKIYIGFHNPKCLTYDVKQVIYSPAVQKNNPELRRAKRLKIKCQSYPQALGNLTKKYFTIAVSGSHGKSTVAAMIGLLLVRAGLDPTIIVGTKLKEFGDSNFRLGKTKNYLVIEADEHMASFLNYWPKIIVLTTLEPDHLDYYKNFKNYILAFKKFISHLPKTGVLVASGDDKNIQKVIKGYRGLSSVTLYSAGQKEAKRLKKVLKIPGEFNVSNALAALTVARTLSVPDKISLKALSKYKGSWRRFEIRKINLKGKKIIIVNDYAHHPTQIIATLKAAREKFLYPPKFSRRKLRRARKKIWCIFQPHQYQRTYYLFDEFVKAFKEAPIDKIIITDIYSVAGREKREIKEKVNSKKLVKAVNRENVIYIQKTKILDYLKKNLKGREVVIIMGAGDIYKLCEQF